VIPVFQRPQRRNPRQTNPLAVFSVYRLGISFPELVPLGPEWNFLRERIGKTLHNDNLWISKVMIPNTRRLVCNVHG
jgi:hypothetical protein